LKPHLRGSHNNNGFYGCEPTYEELKREQNSASAKISSLLRAYLWGIETKKKKRIEITIFTVASLPMRNWNMHRIAEYNILQKVASLPMRNWNKDFQGNLKSISKLRAYLWGIETRKLAEGQGSLSLLRAYLWGIETCSWYPLVFVSNQVASLPMRNWNFSIDFGSFSIVFGCEPTYEELKQGQ